MSHAATEAQPEIREFSLAYWLHANLLYLLSQESHAFFRRNEVVLFQKPNYVFHLRSNFRIKVPIFHGLIMTDYSE